MNRDGMDLVLDEWLHEGPERGPVHALQRALAATRRVDQRPRWAFPALWVPGSVAKMDTRGLRLTGVVLLLVGLLLVLIAFAMAIGSSKPTTRSLLGPSADGLLAFQGGTAVYVSRIDGSARRALIRARPRPMMCAKRVIDVDANGSVRLSNPDRTACRVRRSTGQTSTRSWRRSTPCAQASRHSFS